MESDSDKEKCVLERLIFMATLVAFAFLPFAASAEGRCPPGQFPVGGPGMLGCAPTGGGAPSPLAEAWTAPWGAIATSPTQLAMGVSNTQNRKRRAEREALDQCKRSGAKDCVIRVSYQNSCVAVASPPEPTPQHLVVGRAFTLENAITTATAECFLQGVGECKVGYSDCSVAVRIR